MATIVTRSGKGSPLTNNEVDANFNNLNSGKAELSGATFTGEIVANAGIALGDNDKATFGASDDLQIYHDGSNSYIKDNGNGDLIIQAYDDIKFQQATDNASLVSINTGGNVTIHSGNLGVSGTVTGTGTSVFASLDISGNIDVDGVTNLDVVDIDGAVDMASTLAVGGVVTANAGVKVDNFTLDGTTLALSSGDFTLDAANNIFLDADGGVINLKDGGTSYGQLIKSSNDFRIFNPISNGDIVFRGNDSDGGGAFTALTLDMSAAGAATFSSNITAGNNGNINIPTASSGNANMSFNGSSFIIVSNSSSANLKLQTSSQDTLTIAANGNLTHHRGNITSTGNITSAGIVKASTTFQATGGSMLFFVPNVGQALIIAQNTGAATFASKISVGGALKVSGQNTVHSTNSLVLGQEGSGVAQLRAYGPNGTTKGQFQFALSANDGSPSTVALAIAADSSATFSAGILTNAEVKVTSTGVDGTYAPILRGVYSGNANETNSIETTVSSVAANSGFKFNVSNGGGSTGQTEALRITRGGTYAPLGMRIGAGTGAIDGTLHVHTASAGTVAASSQADDLVVENSAEGGMTIITPDNQSARIRFTSPSTNNDVGGATIFYRQNINKMLIGTAVSGGTLALASGAGNESMVLDASGAIGFKRTPPVGSHTSWSQLFVGEKGTLISESSNSGGLYGTWLTDNMYIKQSTGAFANVTADQSSAYRQEAGIHQWFSQTSGSANAAITLAERMVLDASGRVAIGTSAISNANTSLTIDVNQTSNNARGLHFYGGADATNKYISIGRTHTSANNYINSEVRFGTEATGNGASFISFATGGANANEQTGNPERLRISSSGNVLVASNGATPSSSQAGISLGLSGPNGGKILIANTLTSTFAGAMVFVNGNGQVGSIATSGSATSYVTSSDQRLKENIADADDSGTKVDAIQVRKFDWKADGSHQDYGMVAQELQAVAPEAVSAPEDSAEMMGVDYSKLVPMLIKEIQSLRQRVAQLEE